MLFDHAPFGAVARLRAAIPNDRFADAPIRNVVRKSPKRMSFTFESRKSPYRLGCESENEYLYAHHLEVDPEVAYVWSQPHRLRFSIDGEPHSYVPDFFVRLTDGSGLVTEIKTAHNAESDENRELFAHLRVAYAKLGLAFRVVTAEEVRTEPLLTNCRLLCRYRYPGVSRSFAIRLAEALEVGRPATLGDLCDLLGSIERHWAPVLCAVTHGYVRIELSVEITRETRLVEVSK